jgi:hypothetical protein
MFEFQLETPNLKQDKKCLKYIVKNLPSLTGLDQGLVNFLDPGTYGSKWDMHV